MVVFLDNNATTYMNREALDEYIKWLDVSDTDVVNKFIEQTKKMLKKALRANKYEFIITSGSSESNSTFIEMILRALKKAGVQQPHIAASVVEHKNIIEHVKALEKANQIKVSWIYPDEWGFITPKAVKDAVKSTTRLVLIMHSNNETGAINDIDGIIKEVRKISKKAVFYTDTTQSIGKMDMDMDSMDVEGFTISFHKLHGPRGVGILAIKQDLLSGWKLEPIIYGAQNNGLRGGTYNLPGIAASIKALQVSLCELDSKIEKQRKLRDALIKGLNKKWYIISYNDYIKPHKNIGDNTYIVAITQPGANRNYLPNTFLMSFIKPKMCNVELRRKLRDNGVIVGIGSACNISDPNASHVIRAMPNIDKVAEIKKGVIRVTLDWLTPLNDIIEFILKLEESVNSIR